MRNGEKHLHCQAGPYRLLVSVHDILEIADYHPAVCEASGNAALHHRKTVTWRNHDIPFLGLRQCLQLEPAEPANTVIVQGDNQEPIAMLAVDSVYGILSVEEDKLFHFEGIHAELNTLFDLLYLDPASDQMLMHLRQAAAWIPAFLQPIEP